MVSYCSLSVATFPFIYACSHISRLSVHVASLKIAVGSGQTGSYIVLYACSSRLENLLLVVRSLCLERPY